MYIQTAATDRTEPYRLPAVHELVMDVDGGGTGVVVMWCCGAVVGVM